MSIKVLGALQREWKVEDLRRVLIYFGVRLEYGDRKQQLFEKLGWLAKRRKLTIRDRWTALRAVEVNKCYTFSH